MKKILMMAALMVLTLSMAMTSCSKDDDDSTEQTAKTDPALIGEWVVSYDTPGYGESALFDKDGAVLLHLSQKWYYGDYTANGKTINAHIFRVGLVVTDEQGREQYPRNGAPYMDRIISYSISGNTLTLQSADPESDRTIALKKK